MPTYELVLPGLTPRPSLNVRADGRADGPPTSVAGSRRPVLPGLTPRPSLNGGLDPATPPALTSQEADPSLNVLTPPRRQLALAGVAGSNPPALIERRQT